MNPLIPFVLALSMLVTQKTYYFAVTAYNALAEESDYSNEVVYTFPYTNGTSASITMAWDLETDPSVMGYNLYWGKASRSYSNSVSFGITNEATVTLIAKPPPPRPRVEILTFSTTNLFIFTRTNLTTGSWISNHVSSMTVSNPVGQMFYGVPKPAKITITTNWINL